MLKFICCDIGAYGGSENQKLAKEHNVDLVASALKGKAPDPVYAGFAFSEDGTEATSCSEGNKPQRSKFYESNGTFRALMTKKCCENCPNRECYLVRKQKKSFVVTVSPKMVQRAQYLGKLSTEGYLKLTRMRNADEGIPSVMRRRYNVDHSPFLGSIRTGWTYALAVGAYNTVKLFKSCRRQRGQCAQIWYLPEKGVE